MAEHTDLEKLRGRKIFLLADEIEKGKLEGERLKLQSTPLPADVQGGILRGLIPSERNLRERILDLERDMVSIANELRGWDGTNPYKRLAAITKILIEAGYDMEGK